MHPRGLASSVGEHRRDLPLDGRASTCEQFGRDPLTLHACIRDDLPALGVGCSRDLGSIRRRGRADQLCLRLDLVKPREQQRDLTGQLLSGGWDRHHPRRRPRRGPGAPQPLEQLGERAHGARDASTINSTRP